MVFGYLTLILWGIQPISFHGKCRASDCGLPAPTNTSRYVILPIFNKTASACFEHNYSLTQDIWLIFSLDAVKYLSERSAASVFPKNG